MTLYVTFGAQYSKHNQVLSGVKWMLLITLGIFTKMGIFTILSASVLVTN